MAAAKGNNYNPKGRPIGAKSKKTLQWEQFADYCMNQGLEKFCKELETLEGGDYVKAFLNLIEYFKPKLSRVDQQLSSKSGFSLADILNKAKENDNGVN